MEEKIFEGLKYLIYYPKEKVEMHQKSEENIEDWYKITLYRLIEISKRVAGKYSRSKVRKTLPTNFAYSGNDFLDNSKSSLPNSFCSSKAYS